MSDAYALVKLNGKYKDSQFSFDGTVSSPIFIYDDGVATMCLEFDDVAIDNLKDVEIKLPLHSDIEDGFITQGYNQALEDFAKALLSNDIVDKSVVRRVKEQMKR